jgi:chitodextrinase
MAISLAASSVVLIVLAAASSAAASDPPQCDAGGPYGCAPGHPLDLDGSASFDPDGTIVAYHWDFGDGHSGAGAIVSHIYADGGTFVVSLLVIDDDQSSSLCTTTADIGTCGDCPPVCNSGGPYYGVAGEPVELDGSGSLSVFTCIPLVAYEWDFGDGTTGSGPTPTHVYATNGTYWVRLTVWDADAWVSACFTTAMISPPNPVEPTTWGALKSRAGH